MKKRKRKIKWKKIISLLVIIICLSLIIFSSIKIINWFLSNKRNQQLKEQINQYITINKENTINDVEMPKYTIEWDKIKSQNKDALAYLKVNNTNIDYIILKGTNNSYYLNHNFNKENNISGWVFADFRNNVDGTDKNLVVFAHDTKDGSMFGTLKNVLNKEWYINPDNYIIDLVTEQGLLQYQVFSVYNIMNEEYYIQTTFKKNEFSNFINTIKNRSIYNFNVNLTNEDNILTLSTCSDNGLKRIVLHAKLLKY